MNEKKIPHTKNALMSFSEAIESIADKVSQSVVGVRSKTRGTGSGVVWTSDGLIVTCSHIVRKLDELEVSFSNGRSFPANVIGNDLYSDIALLKIQANGKNDSISLNPIEIGNSENLKAGQFVLALANPYGEFPSITEGIITSERSSIGGGRWWEITNHIVITDARLNPGYSGGPLVDVEGRMIGLNAAYVSSRGIAIRASKVRNITDQLARDGSIKTAYLGVATDEISIPREIGSQLEPSQEEGLMVLSVEKDTPAKKAGLLMGDIIIGFDDRTITNIHDLRKQLLNHDVIGKSVKLAIIRGEKRSEINISPRESSGSN
ncbi:MAG TPA: trypsin-like peptidase domain-containing protein [Candidatus Nitrosopolaris sp.]|nr:trypsin-like peptidase domain-containing protein [Candidatus Nitrosopolaris sp.]